MYPSPTDVIATISSYKLCRSLQLAIRTYHRQESRLHWTLSAQFIEPGQEFRDKIADDVWLLQWKSFELEQSLAVRKAELDDDLDLYSASQRRQLCIDMYDRLPRELRDAVYGCMHEGSTIKVHGRTYELPDGCKRKTTYLHPEPGSSSDYLEPAFYWKPSLVGKGFKRELIKMWYRTSVFDLETDTYLARDLVSRDRWELGINARQLIKHIALDVGPEIERGFWVWRFSPRLDKLVEDLLQAGNVLNVHVRFAPVKEGWKVLWALIGGSDGVQSQSRSVLTTLQEGFRQAITPFHQLEKSGHKVIFVAPGWDDFAIGDLALPEPAFVAKFEKVGQLSSHLVSVLTSTGYDRSYCGQRMRATSQANQWSLISYTRPFLWQTIRSAQLEVMSRRDVTTQVERKRIAGFSVAFAVSV